MTDFLSIISKITIDINGNKTNILDNIIKTSIGDNFKHRCFRSFGITVPATADSYILIKNTGKNNENITVFLGPTNGIWTIKLLPKECALYRIYSDSLYINISPQVTCVEF